ncbi:insecticidal toxin complex protein TcaB2 [Pseudomonas sp. B21-056]|uniref:Tc toxin subunit A-related protein n=1 Tax=Pseudomonas sp. B21-056 TaxID=2895495 RepID=UPI002230CCE0|nr:neuraminidase-like domain-containing protein [Pseudomonas sp. B21-056]UZE22657.1 insecticidal toxin complex protein TcaB2 [Pseudomonas sp. B21-056]
MATQDITRATALRRDALIECALGIKEIEDHDANKGYPPIKTADDLLEWLRTDPLDNHQVKTTWVAEAVSCFQQYIHAVYQKLEPGYTQREFDRKDLKDWDIASQYPLWAASQLLKCMPEDYITPYARIRKTSLFRALENNLNQTRLTTDSVQSGVQQYLRAFEEVCNLDVLNGYVDGPDARRADYYLVGRERIAPYRYFWRKADVQLDTDTRTINPAAWSEWQPVDIPADAQVLDSRLVFWGGRLCLVWAEWREALIDGDGGVQKPYELELKVAFITLDGKWSPPVRLSLSAFNEDVSPGCRLVAVMLRDDVDPLYPKGRLAVHLTNAPAGFTALHPRPVEIYETRDALFRKVADEKPIMDHLAMVRFASPSTLQQRVATIDFSQMTEEVSSGANPLVEHFTLKAVVTTDGSKQYLHYQAHCALLTPGKAGEQKTFTLSLRYPAGDDIPGVEEPHSDNGGWSFAWQQVERDNFANLTATFVMEGPGDFGKKTFTLTLKGVPAAPSLPSVHKTNPRGAQFLHLNDSGLTLKYARLNTLIGAELVTRANVSIDAVLDWDTQFPDEPPLPENASEPNGPFDGANGLFFWELFFHLPHLVATRLKDEDRFVEAQQWLHFIFDPQAIADANAERADPKPRYWRCRPLNVASAEGDVGCEADNPTDPDAIAYSTPRHYQMLIFLDYVANLVAWGDWLYRQLTRDSLAAAKMQYLRAKNLMGATPDVHTLSQWTPATLAELVDELDDSAALKAFEQGLLLDSGSLPVKTRFFEDPGVIGAERFRLPVSQRVLLLYELPAQRMYNLRNNLTIDGKPLSIELFSTINPSDLLNNLAAGGAGPVRPMGGPLRVAAFRWRTLFDTAIRATQYLQDCGNQVMRLLEQQDRGEQELLQQRHLTELSTFARAVQEENLEQLRGALAAMNSSRTLTEQRQAHYTKLYSENISNNEYKVMGALDTAKLLTSLSTSMQVAGAVIDAFPNVFGLANGGHQLGSAPRALSYGFQVAAEIVRSDAEKDATSESYRRRREDWGLARDQATAELAVLDAQIEAQKHAVSAAEASLEQILRMNAHAQALYDFLLTRATRVELYRWYLGQCKTLHYQAYDQVVSLCLSAQSALQLETAEFGLSHIRTDAWLDNYYGLTAGDSLRLDLLRMEADYLLRYERRLEMVKTVSLRLLFDDDTDRQVDYDNWNDARAGLIANGTLNFKLSQLLFDRDYHDHYCRQISAVDVTLPTLLGPYENVCATLTQIGSSTAIKASRESLDYLYDESFPAPADVLLNIGSGEQMALSIGLDDFGVAALKPEEGLRNTFENTGAVSRWTLSFPWFQEWDRQKGQLAALNDIIVKVRYTAKVGGPAFSRKVQEKVRAAESAAHEGLQK